MQAHAAMCMAWRSPAIAVVSLWSVAGRRGVQARHLVHKGLQLLALLLSAQRVDGDQLLRKAPQLLQLLPIPRHGRTRARNAVQQRKLRVWIPADICCVQTWACPLGIAVLCQ